MREAGVFIPAEAENSDHDEELVLADMSASESGGDSDYAHCINSNINNFRHFYRYKQTRFPLMVSKPFFPLRTCEVIVPTCRTSS